MFGRELYEKPQYTIPNDENQTDNDSWNYHYHKLIKSLQGNEIQKETIIRKRILRYFGQFKLDSESYLSIRNDVDYSKPGIQIYPQKLILYGVDYLTIERAKNYFSGFITNILRIDDSHFMVQFRNQNQCLAAINKCRKGQQMYFSPQDMFKSSNQGWIQMKPYYQFIFQRKLMTRYATNLDKTDNIAATTRQSCAFAYSQAKRRFMKSLKQDFEQNDRLRSQRTNKQQKRIDRERSNSRQRSRSRGKYMNSNCFRRDNLIRPQIANKGCFCSGKPLRVRSRSRSRSRSPSMESQRNRSNQPQKLIQQKIKQSDFKFELYIKRRDQKAKKKPIDLEPSARALSSIDQIHHQAINHLNSSDKNSKDNSTNNDDIDLEIVEGPESQPFDAVDTNQMDFEKYLQKLKLDDSKNDYSAFDLEQMEI